MWRLSLMKFGKSECDQTRDRLSTYLDHRLGLQDRGEVERHLETCQECRQELGSLQEAVQWLHQVPQVLPVRSFAIREARALPSRSPFPVLRTATAVLAVFLVLIFAFDMTNLFHAGPVSAPENGAQYYKSENGSSADGQGSLGSNGIADRAGANEGEGEVGWIRPLEYGVLGGVVLLGGATMAMWRGRRRALFETSNEDDA